jgi:hypothetical protein
MVDTADQGALAPDRKAVSRWGAALAIAVQATGPPLLFGLRLWASVCLALYVAGGANGEVFTLAITRVSEIWIGIVCAGIVLAGTDFGGAPRRLAALLGALSAQIASSFGSALTPAGSALSDMQPVRRELVRQVIALGPVIDQAIGESSKLRYHSRVLQATKDGLFKPLAGWSAVVSRVTRLPDDTARQEADAVLNSVPLELPCALSQGDTTPWVVDPSRMRRLCDAVVRRLVTMPAGTRSVRLIADQTAGLSDVLDGLALLVADPARSQGDRRRARPHVPDWLPALVNAGRTFVSIGAVEVFWIATAWPNGASAITFAAISVIIFAPKADVAAMPSAVILIILSVRYHMAEGKRVRSVLQLYALGAQYDVRRSVDPLKVRAG